MGTGHQWIKPAQLIEHKQGSLHAYLSPLNARSAIDNVAVAYSSLQFYEGTPNRQQSEKSEGFYLLFDSALILC